MEEKNAIIKSSVIEIEDHGILTAWIHLNFGASGQGFGGYSLDSSNDPKGNYAGHFIRRVLEIAEVREWGMLQGKTVRIKGTRKKIDEIGHIVKDDWFNPEEDFKKMSNELNEDN